jgi:hypothetical protein
MLAIALVVASEAAHAAPEHPDDPEDLVARPIVLDEGGVDLRLTAEIAVRNYRPGRPLSLAPDGWWGVARDWTIGVIHSDASVDQIEAGATLCVRDSSVPTCSHPYRGSGVDVRYGAVAGALAVAPRVRLLVRDVDPFKPAMTLGALVRWTRGRFAIASDPFLRVPLANGDLGNRSALSIPLWLSVQPARGWMITAHTGFDADLAVLRDGSHAPFGLGVTARATPEVDVALEAGWGRLFGPQYNAKSSAVLITAGWHR